MPDTLLQATDTIGTIANTIRYGAMKFETHTGTHPTKIYIGRFQDTLLQALVSGDRFTVWTKTEDKRREWCGMEVFVVDARHHLGFGI